MNANQGSSSRSGNNSRRGKAPEFERGTLRQDRVLDVAEKYLGKGYSEVGKNSGRYISENGLRQVRFGKHEVSKRLHIHFEVFNTKGGRIIETATAEIIP